MLEAVVHLALALQLCSIWPCTYLIQGPRGRANQMEGHHPLEGELSLPGRQQLPTTVDGTSVPAGCTGGVQRWWPTTLATCRIIKGGGRCLTPFLDVLSSPRCIGMPTHALDNLPCSPVQGLCLWKSQNTQRKLVMQQGSEEAR